MRDDDAAIDWMSFLPEAPQDALGKPSETTTSPGRTKAVPGGVCASCVLFHAAAVASLYWKLKGFGYFDTLAQASGLMKRVAVTGRYV